MKKNGILLVLMLAVLFFYGCSETTTVVQPQAGTEKVKVYLIAEAGDQTILEKEIDVAKGANAFDVMKANASIKYTEYDIGPFIEEIEGVKPSPEEFWALYINDEMASQGISAYSLNEDTKIAWKIESQGSYAGRIFMQGGQHTRLIDLMAVAYLFFVLGLIFLNLETFISLTIAYPLPMGFLKLAALATFGEFVKIRRSTGKWNFRDWHLKLIVWGLFGAWFALVFPLFGAGISAIVNKGLWPDFGSVFKAFSTSLWMNLLALYAWPMMLVHEYFNKVIEKKRLVSLVKFGEELDKKTWFGFIPLTILIFWLPAHTITFLLPEEFRVLMAALLSVALGFILTIKKK